jgi:transposase
MNTILCLEFAAEFSSEQKTLIDQWLESSRVIYNRGLAELEDWDRNTGYYVPKGVSDRVNQKGEAVPYYAPVCQLPWKMYRDADGNNIPYSEILSDYSRWYVKQAPLVKVPTPAEQKDSWGWKMEGASGYSCPRPVDYSEPLLKSWQLQSAGGLGQVAKGDYWRNGQILEMPYKFRAGVLTMLETPWQEYLKSRMGKSDGPKRGKPKPKRKSDTIDTIIHPNPKGVVVHDGKDFLKGIPQIGRVRVPKLSRRWRDPDGSFPPISTFKIIRRHGRYFVQLTGALERSFPVKRTFQAVGIDPGLAQEFSLSTGEQIAPKKFYRKSEDKRTKLQREIAHKRTHNLILWLNHNDRTVNDIKTLIAVKDDDAKQLLTAKTEAAIVELIGGSRLNRLKYGIPKSNRLAVLELRLKKLDRMTGSQRKAEDDKLTSRIVRNYGAIAVEDGLQSANLKKKANAKLDDQGRYTKNNANAKSGLAKSLSDASPGRKIAMLKHKSNRSGRAFVKVPSPYTSIACPVSAPDKGFDEWVKEKHYTSNLDGDRMYRSDAGWIIDRDLNSGVNIELMAFGGDLDYKLSANANRARILCCKYSLTQKNGWKPRWASKLSASKWIEIRDTVLAGIVADNGGAIDIDAGQIRSDRRKSAAKMLDGGASKVVPLQ